MEKRHRNPEERREILLQMAEELLPTTAAYEWELFLKRLHNAGQSESQAVELLFENINKYISGTCEEPTSPLLITENPKLCQEELLQYIQGKFLPINTHLAKYFSKLSFESEPQTFEELHIAAATQIRELRNDIDEQRKKIKTYTIDTRKKEEFTLKLKKLEDRITQAEETLEGASEEDMIKEQRKELQIIRYEFNSIKYKLRDYENNHRPG